VEQAERTLQKPKENEGIVNIDETTTATTNGDQHEESKSQKVAHITKHPGR
jgi:hypothetical protein